MESCMEKHMVSAPVHNLVHCRHARNGLIVIDEHGDRNCACPCKVGIPCMSSDM